MIYIQFQATVVNMDSQEFKVRGRQMVDYIIQYLEVRILFLVIFNY